MTFRTSTSLKPICLFLIVAALAMIFAACGSTAQVAGGDEGSTVPLDILVVPPESSQLPAQVFRDVPYANLADGSYDLPLSFGSAFTAFVTTTSGAPLDHASVRVTMQGYGVSTVRFTDPEGRVVLPLGAGTYDIHVTPDAANTDYYGVPPRVFRDIVIGAGGGPVNRDLLMPAGFRIRGTVLGPPPGGAVLQGWRISAHNDAGDLATSTNTTLLGFEIFVSSTGSWAVQCTPPNNTGSPITEKTIDITEASTDFDFQYPVLPEHVLTGQVSGAGGGPGTFAGVTVRARAQLSSADPTVKYTFDQKAFSDVNGNFSLDVLGGNYAITIEPGLDLDFSHRVLDNIDVTADTPLSAASTTLFPKVDVGGRVTGSFEGSPDALIRLFADDGTAYQFIGTSDASGSWSVRMDLGDYDVLVLPSPDSGLVRIASTVSVTEPFPDLDFPLAVGHRVRGRVLAPAAGGGTPLANTKVTAIDPAALTAIGSAESVSDESGLWALTIPIVP